MKVGDLVTRHPDVSHDYKGKKHPSWTAGVVTKVEACGTHVKIHWADKGAFWCPVNRVEVINESG
jgi:hypothetical protein